MAGLAMAQGEEAKVQNLSSETTAPIPESCASPEQIPYWVFTG